MTAGPLRHDRGLVGSWTAVTVLSLVVGTLGITEIARRIFDPLHLDSRAGIEEPIEVVDRTAIAKTTTGATFPENEPSPGGPAPPATQAAERPMEAVGPTLPAGTWEVATPPTSTTRWQRNGGTAEDPVWSLVYDDLDGSTKQGYANNGETALLTPWMARPPGETVVLGGRWRISLEPDYDKLELHWTADGRTWTPLTTVAGRAGPSRWETMPSPAVPGRGPVRLRITFTSDAASSTQDAGIGWQFTQFAGVDVTGIHLATASGPVLDVPGAPIAIAPTAVLAVDRLANPYHAEFRDRTARAYAHPSTYLDGYPVDAIAVHLSLDLPYEEAVERDAAIWEGLLPRTLYWFPGTRIVAAYDVTVPCATSPCLFDRAFAEAPHATKAVPPGTTSRGDENGSTYASGAVGSTLGACPSCLLATVPSPRVRESTAEQASWVASHAGWIDAQAFGYDHLFVHHLDGDNRSRTLEARRNIAEAARRHLVLTPTSSTAVATAAVEDQSPHLGGTPQAGPSILPLSNLPGVVHVGIHDQGHVVDGADPPHLVAQGCGRRGARAGTSTAYTEVHGHRSGAMYWALGRAGQVLSDARRILGASRTGIRNGIAAEAAEGAGLPDSGPLADGVLTQDEWRRLLLATATARPETAPDRSTACSFVEVQHDGVTDPDAWARPWRVGTWSWSTPVAVEDFPPGYPTWLHVGYGAIDSPAAIALVTEVLHGRAPLPDRPQEDAWFSANGTFRQTLQGVLP